MKQTIKLANSFFHTIFRRLMVIIGLMLVAEFVYFFAVASTEYDCFRPFSEMIDAVAPLFFVAFLAVLLLLGSAAEQYTTKSKGVYTLMTLPMDRSSIVFAYLLCGFTSLLLLIAAQVLLVFLSYYPIMAIAANTASRMAQYGRISHDFSPFLHNGLFLTVMRSGLMRLLLPFTLSGLLSTFALLLTMASSVYTSVFMPRRRGGRLYPWPIVFVFAFALVQERVYAFARPYPYEASPVTGYGATLLLLVFTASNLWSTCRNLQKGRNLL